MQWNSVGPTVDRGRALLWGGGAHSSNSINGMVGEGVRGHITPSIPSLSHPLCANNVCFLIRWWWCGGGGTCMGLYSPFIYAAIHFSFTL